jgi:hypothetical protein
LAIVGELFKQNADKPATKPETPIQEPISQSASTPSIQRKVYIKKTLIGGFRHKTKTSHGSEGEGDRNVDSMMDDFPSRYFNSKDEMRQYAGNSTEKVGYIKTAEADSNPELTKDLQGRDEVINQKFKGAEGERSHRAERRKLSTLSNLYAA